MAAETTSSPRAFPLLFRCGRAQFSVTNAAVLQPVKQGWHGESGTPSLVSAMVFSRRDSERQPRRDAAVKHAFRASWFRGLLLDHPRSARHFAAAWPGATSSAPGLFA